MDAFLREGIRFPEMGDVVSGTLDRMGSRPVESLEQILEVDREARAVASEIVRRLGQSSAPA